MTKEPAGMPEFVARTGQGAANTPPPSPSEGAGTKGLVWAREDHVTCCCTDTLIDNSALVAACQSGRIEIIELSGRLVEALAERDRARDTAVRLEAELARTERP